MILVPANLLGAFKNGEATLKHVFSAINGKMANWAMAGAKGIVRLFIVAMRDSDGDHLDQC